ncbi:MAG: histidinol dehydrogenase, partial [Gammaproteobacteria bacterium]|nr:histidinol dehydrogenase [Gammaproteobacteria bacterium]
MLDIRRLSTLDADFSVHLNNLLQQNQSAENDVRQTVEAIIKDIRENGDQALLAYTKKFDQVTVKQASELEISKTQMQKALTKISAEHFQALEAAAKRIRSYAERQGLESWSSKDEDGNELGQVVSALEKVGVYVPGGKAAYPSSVLMNVIPAKVAGVDSIIMVVPTPNGEVNDMVMAAASIAGVDRVFTIGGAQAVAALAYGTET